MRLIIQGAGEGEGGGGPVQRSAEELTQVYPGGGGGVISGNEIHFPRTGIHVQSIDGQVGALDPHWADAVVGPGKVFVGLPVIIKTGARIDHVGADGQGGARQPQAQDQHGHQ